MHRGLEATKTKNVIEMRHDGPHDYDYHRPNVTRWRFSCTRALCKCVFLVISTCNRVKLFLTHTTTKLGVIESALNSVKSEALFFLLHVFNFRAVKSTMKL